VYDTSQHIYYFYDIYPPRDFMALSGWDC